MISLAPRPRATGERREFFLNSPITWEELSQKTYTDPEFLLDPYIPKEGIVFLWGKTSIGKSPLAWHLASAVGSGTSFFGLPTKESRVYFLELDTPELSVAGRIQKMPPARNVWFDFLPPLSIPYVSPEEAGHFLWVQKEIRPDLVVVNTLRKSHDMDDKDSRTPKLVYSFFQKTFPDAAFLFVHHERKTPQDPRFTSQEREGFSGANAWLNDAQVGLHLERYDGLPKENLRLYHRKSQVSELLKPIPLRLGEDGTELRSPLFDEFLKTYEILNDPPEGISKNSLLDAYIAKALGVSERTAKRRRLSIISGEFPASRAFLSDRSVAHGDE